MKKPAKKTLKKKKISKKTPIKKSKKKPAKKAAKKSKKPAKKKPVAKKSAVKKKPTRKPAAKKKSTKKPAVKKAPVSTTLVVKAEDKPRVNMGHTNSVYKNGVYIKAYQGDHMTMLAFDIDDSLNTNEFVGFTLSYKTPSKIEYQITNKLNFTGEDKLTDSKDSPIQKFRWLHVPGNIHQDFSQIETGTYTYFVTPRYYDKQAKQLRPLDNGKTSSVEIEVGNPLNGIFDFGFTRAYINSQAYKYRFGSNTKLIPDGDWLFDTQKIFETYNGSTYKYEDVYKYLGFTARQKIIDLLTTALNDKSITVEMLIYDFNEPVIGNLCLELAKEGRIKIISDDYVNRSTNKQTGKVKEAGHGLPDADETDFCKKFNGVKKGKADLVRGCFARFQHHKVIVFSKNWQNPYMVLSGATNFSVTGTCVNANHIVIVKDTEIATLYSNVFKASWGTDKMKTFKNGELASKPFEFNKNGIKVSFNFSPHKNDYADSLLKEIAGNISNAKQSVLFSVMEMGKSGGDVIPALKAIHKDTNIFSYGITDQVEAENVQLYRPGVEGGILVNAKSLMKMLPPPFNEEANYNAHRIHHKFVVVDFNTPTGKVYFGSSNLALGGEEQNGDNLICVQDPKITTVFAVEALRLVDHFQFRVNKDKNTDAASNKENVITLKTDNSWAKPYFDEKDMKFLERHLFA